MINKNGKTNVIKETDNNEISINDLETDKIKISKRLNEIDKINMDHVNNESVIEANELENKTVSEENTDMLHSNKKQRCSARLKNKPQISYNENDNYYNLSAQVNLHDVPKSYNDVKNRSDKEHWQKAIKEEIDSLIKNQTWKLVPVPNNKNIVDCRWVFVMKRINGVDKYKYKARLVAKGFSQEYKLDYFDTFAPVARITTFRLMLSFANQNNMLIHQMDVKTAFLHGQLSEEIYMRVPDGINSGPNTVCKLLKSLYGLKQAARCWYQHFDQIIKQYGFLASSVDHCLYYINNKDNSKCVYLLLYVDDILIFAHSQQIMIQIKQYLKHNFEMVDMQEVKTFLGINIKRKEGILTLDQTEYLTRVIDRFNMRESNTVSTPLPLKLDYDNLNSDIYHESPCRELLGCLMYAMLCTRPDLCIALNLLSRYQNKNNIELWQSLKRILRYVKGTLKVKLVYKKNNFTNLLKGYADADWASNEIDRKSVTGYVFQLYDNCSISWNSKRQNSVATSSTEAEYMALFESVKEACWLKSLINSIQIDLKSVTIFEDNNGCIAIAKNPTHHKRSKHIEVRYHFTREKIEEKIINVEYIYTGDQLADMFTKQLPAVTFTKMRNNIGLKEIENE